MKDKDELDIIEFDSKVDSANVNEIVAAMLGMIPVGGPILSAISNMAFETYQNEKRKELLDIICNSRKLTSDKISAPFIINTKRIVEAIDRLSTNDKVVYFSNLLKNEYIENDSPNESEFDECFYALNILSKRQIVILNELVCIEEKYDLIGEKHDLSKYTTWFDEFIENTACKLNCSAGMVISLLGSMTSTGLCREFTGAFFDYSGEMFHTTPLCHKLISLIRSSD